jgi:hypothetical protein
MELVNPDGWRLVLLRVLQVIFLLASGAVTARFLFSDTIWIVAIAADVLALAGILYLYWRARRNRRINESEAEW